MTQLCSGGFDGGATRRGAAVGRGADWLALAAAPTFATMALLTAASGGSDMICAVAQDASPFGGMVWMYLLMSAFHSAPWLKLATRRGADGANDEDPHER
jgi:hypothetical protein